MIHDIGDTIMKEKFERIEEKMLNALDVFLLLDTNRHGVVSKQDVLSLN